jgi:hypothetical protein
MSSFYPSLEFWETGQPHYGAFQLSDFIEEVNVVVM